MALAISLLLATAPALAADPPATADLARADRYCIACHSANDARLANPFAWDGHVARAALSPCPTVRQLRQEMAFTDDAFDAIRNGGIADLEARLLAREESLPRLVETAYSTVDAGVNEMRAFRYQLNKTYAQAQAVRDSATMQVVLVVGVLATLFLLASLAWGLWNTRHLSVPMFRGFRMGMGAVVFVLLVFAVFALPLFNPPAPTEAATAADLERQAALDTATRAAVSAENLSAKAWQFARLGQFDAARAALDELETNANAYWGRARALEESAVTWDKAADAAPPLVHRIEVAAARAWAYAAVVDEIGDPRRAAELLDTALARAQRNPDPYFRALDLKKIAVAWSRLDQTHAARVAGQIADPFIRAWALREIGQFDQAAASARAVGDAHLRAFALREIAVASKNANLLDEITSYQLPTAPAAGAYALSDLAAAWGAFDAKQSKEIADSIAAQFPDARARAFRRSGRFVEAWAELEKFDGFEQARAQSELVAAWARVAPNDALDAAQKIRDPFLSAEAQRAVVAALARPDAARALDLARAIPIPYARVQALTDVARVSRDPATFQQAAALADDLRDPYPLRDLASAWAQVDPKNALALVDKLDRESDRAQALLAVALVTKESAVFERAVKQAQGARLRGDPLYSAELLRELGARYAAVDATKAKDAFDAAFDAARKVTTEF
ncbi:MAG: hypothetical protein HY782_17540 [Chloroflexi bacterium]|nr:hypothetical protein [Chloroflexota bacterium]